MLLINFYFEAVKKHVRNVLFGAPYWPLSTDGRITITRSTLWPTDGVIAELQVIAMITCTSDVWYRLYAHVAERQMVQELVT